MEDKKKNNNEKYDEDEITDINLYTGGTVGSVKESMKRLEDAIRPFAELVRSGIAFQSSPAMDNLRSTLAGFSAVLSNYDYSGMMNSLNTFRENLSRLLSNISIPSYTEEDIQRIKDSFEAWGKFGWTCNPAAPWKLFYTAPMDSKEANKIARKYCVNAEAIFEEIETSKRVTRSLQEVKNTYEKGYYRSCALILFSMVDACLIRGQKKEPKKRRKVGNRALKDIKERLNQDEETLIQMMLIANYTACIEEMYKDGNDFASQPQIINRNFLAHGMLWRDVKRQDCQQLLLLYYNTLLILDMVYGF